MRCKSLTTLVLLLGAFPLTGRQEQPGKPEAEAELLMRPVNLPSSPLSVNLAIQTAILGSGIPGSAVITQGCAERSDSAVRFRGSTLREVLDDIVTADPDYGWEVKDGVVNLIPAKGVPDLLTLRIGAFDTGEATDVTTAKTFLFALPEVRKRAAELGFDQAIFGSGLYGAAPGTPPPPKLNVRLQDVTLLEALNALVRAPPLRVAGPTRPRVMFGCSHRRALRSGGDAKRLTEECSAPDRPNGCIIFISTCG
jgi:hypothetical protein